MARASETSAYALPFEPRGGPWGHGLLAAISASAFEQLNMAASLWIRGDEWELIHWTPSVVSAEIDFAKGPLRWSYNFRMFAQVREKRRTLRGEHSGFYDLFVPVRGPTGARGILVVGPFTTSYPSAAVVAQRWYDVTRTQPRLTDVAFARYVAATLSTLTLEGPMAQALVRFMESFAALASDEGDAMTHFERLSALRAQLLEARLPDRMWDVAGHLVDAQTSRAWPAYAGDRLTALGLELLPLHIVVGLVLPKQEIRDPLEGLLRRAAYQRACTRLASSFGRTISGRVGDYGISFLVDDPASSRRIRPKLLDLVARANALAKRHNFGLHVGIASATSYHALPETYVTALHAAEQALAQRVPLVEGEARSTRAAEPLSELRRQLDKISGDRPSELADRFGRYIDAALNHAGYDLGGTRAVLERGLERLSERLLDVGSFDRKALTDMQRAMENAAANSQTVAELVGVYRGLAADLEKAVLRPTAARQERTTRRAQNYIAEHLAEPLSLKKVAKIAGFAPSHFARLFKQEERVPFSDYVRALRIERAKQLLGSTALSVEQIQRLVGFRARTHFHRAFKRAEGITPAEFRVRQRQR
jgi:AraC-like DNA-binding protein